MVEIISFVKDIFFGGGEKKAGDQRALGLTEGIEEERRQFNLTRRDLAPGIERGNTAGEREAEFLGLRGADAERRAIEGFTESPGQAFLRQRAERALLRNSAATGGTGGGRVLEALNEQAIGIAGGQLSERKDRLAAVARGGLNQVTNQASFGQQSSANIANLLAERGDVRGDTIQNVNDARKSGLSRIAGMFI